MTLDSDTVGLKFKGSWGTFNFPRRHVKALPDERATSDQLPLSELQVGNLAKIVRADSRYNGRVGTVVSLTAGFVDLKIGVGTFQFSRSQVVAVEESGSEPDAPRARALPPSLSATDHQAQRGVCKGVPDVKVGQSRSDLQVRGYAKVIAPGDDHYGRVGQIDPAYEDDKHILLRFEGDQDPCAYERSEVEPVRKTPAGLNPLGEAVKKISATPSQVDPATSSTMSLASPRRSLPSLQPPSGSATPVQRYWTRLPTAGRIAVVAIPAALIGVIVIIAGLNTSSDTGLITADSGFSGHRGDRDARALQADTGLNDPAGYAEVVCNLRAKGVSEQRTIELNATDLHGKPARSVTDQDALAVVASEYHFCPEYYRR